VLAILAKLSVFLIVLCAATATAVACSGGVASTSLKTSLSGGGKEGEEITVAEGTGVKDQATLSGENSGKATGTITYAVYSDKACKELVTKAGEVTVKEGKVPASEEKKLEATAVYYWQAVYSGDTNNAGSASTCGKEVLTVKATTTLKTTLSGGGKEGEEITVAEGSGVKDTATLSGTKSSSATGNVKYALYSDKECKTLVSKAGEGSVKEGKAAASEEKKPEAGAIYYWQAEYGGDSLHEASISTCGKEVLTVKATTTLKTTLSGGGKEGEEITVAEGSKVKDQATISGTKSSSAKGTIKYAVYKDKECKELASKAGEGEVKEGKAPASEEKELEAGAIYYWLAEYEGDSLHESSKSACGKEVLTVKAATSLKTSLKGEGKEGEEITVEEGAEIVDTATLSGTKAATATGNVKYAVYSDSECEKLVAKAGEVSVEGGKVPISSAEKPEAGVYHWQAVYSGDALHEGSTSPCTEILTVKVATSLTTSLSGEGEEGEEITVTEGAAVKDVATLSGPSASKASGTVEYLVYAGLDCEKLVAKAGEVSVEGESVPASSAVELPEGVYSWQAVYSGDSVNHSATSPCGSEIEVVMAPITTTLSGGEQSGEEIEVPKETAVSDKATLHGPHASEATGTVKYAVYSDDECEGLVTNAGEVTVKEGSVPASEEKKLEAGAVYYWQAEYSGDGKNPAATSICGAEVLRVVTPTSLATTLSAEGESGAEIEVEVGSAVSDEATLSGTNAATAEGYVEYSVYSDSECKELVALAGGASVEGESVPASSEVKLPAGVYYWKAVYSGDGVNQDSASACGSEIEVVMAPITTTLSGGEQSGEEIAVPKETAVSDKATLHGPHASEATGTVKYAVYSDGLCKELVTKAGEVSVEGESVPASSGVKLPEGLYYWQAEYSGDGKNPAATSVCGSERAIVGAPPPKYAALGDSFSAGYGLRTVGTGYYALTDHGIPFQNINWCFRSDHAWPALVANAFYGGGVLNEAVVFQQQPDSFIFRACTAAVLNNLWSAPPNSAAVAALGGQYDEAKIEPEEWFPTPAQDLWLEKPGGVLPAPIEPNDEIKLVTATIGGNDAGFGAIARSCVDAPLAGYTLANCQNMIAAKEATGFPAIDAKLPVVLRDMSMSAPLARIRIALYPRILRLTAGQNILLAGGLANINNVDTNPMAPAGMVGMTAARSIEWYIGKLNLRIEETVAAVAAEGWPVDVISQTATAFNGHRLDDAQPWVYGVFLPEFRRDESFHPNQCGHIALARQVVLAVGEGTPPTLCP